MRTSGYSSVHAIQILCAGLAIAVLSTGGSCETRISADFDQQVIAALAPRQPYDAFFGECPSLVHGNGTTFIVYARSDFDICIKAYDHSAQSLSDPAYIGYGWNDHLRPAIVMDGDGFLHVMYGARPAPMRYHRSIAPLDHTQWSSYEQFGSSATYPVPIILGDSLFVLFREGDSFYASLRMAVRDMNDPIGTPGAWTVTTLVVGSSIFVPIPLGGFERGGKACFLFNMRDALISSPHTSVAPSIREGMSVICTADGASFTDLDGQYLTLPLDYMENRHDFPEVTRHDEYVDIELDQGLGTYDTDDLRYDGSFVELTVTPMSYGQTEILVGDSSGCSCVVEFTPVGDIVLSDDDSWVTIQEYVPGIEYAVRLKLYFSIDRYRPWINGDLAGEPLRFTYHETVPDDELIIDSITLLTRHDCSIGLVSGREFKLITASACCDTLESVNFFFIDRRDSSERSRWRMMHQRGTEVKEIGDTLYHKYHPSSVWIGDYMYVAAAYFEGEGLFHNNEHLTMNSRIMLLGSRDLESWGEMEMAVGSGGHVHPVFKRFDESGLVELIWARMESEVSTSLMHGYFGTPTGFFPEIHQIISVWGIPNPFSSSSTIRLVLNGDHRISVGIYDCAGRCVNRLMAHRPLTAGVHNIPWSGYDARGRKVAPGIYFVRVHSSAFDQTIKIVLIH